MDCETSRTADDIAADVVLAVAAFGRADVAAFDQATADLDAGLPCLTEAVDPQLAASVHRVEGIRAFIDKDDAKLTAAFGAARAIEPEWQFPSSMVKPGHPLRQRYDASLQEDLPVESVPYVAGGYLTIDGRPSWDRLTTLAALVQRLDADGKVIETKYVWAGDPWLDYEVGRPATSRAEWSRERKRLFGAAIGTGLLASGLYSVTYALADAYRSADPSDPESPVRYDNGAAWRQRTNTLFMASVATGAVAIGLGGASIVAKGEP